jgi:hypothetical protein
MLPGLTLPASLAGLPGALRPCFTAPSFRTFCGLAAGLAGQVRRRTVCGMLLGAGLAGAWPHDRAHYFFARARRQAGELGLAVARLVVLLLVPPGDPLTVAVDDSLFRRSGRKVCGAGWQYDGPAPSRDRVSFGTCFVTCGIVVRLPCCTRPVCLPVLARLVPPGTAKAAAPARARKRKKAAPVPGTKLSAAAGLVALLAAAFPGRPIHVVAGAACHGPALKHLPPAVTWTCRLREQAFADARTVLGAGEARNRARRAVERTVPFALLTCTLVITWYARHGHHRAGIAARRHAQPWYHAKTEPAFEDMLTQLRRVLITARISKGSSAHPTPEQTKDDMHQVGLSG